MGYEVGHDWATFTHFTFTFIICLLCGQMKQMIKTEKICEYLDISILECSQYYSLCFPLFLNIILIIKFKVPQIVSDLPIVKNIYSINIHYLVHSMNNSCFLQQ